MVLDEQEKKPSNQTGVATGERKRNGSSRIEQSEGRRREAGGDRGSAIRSNRPGGREKHGSSGWEMKGNLRGKRQDPWRRANDRHQKVRCRPCGLWSGCHQSQRHPNRVRNEHTGRCGRSGLRSLTQHAGGGDTAGRLRCGAEHGLQSSMQDQRSVGKLTASDTRRVKLGAKCQ